MTGSKLPGAAEAFSLNGEPLFQTPLRPETEETQRNLYADALKDYEANPDDADAIIWLGRRTAYLGRFRETATIYTMGVERHPGDPKMYRHRGHRFITLRRYWLAVDDFERATSLIEGKPDGLPNPRCVPVGSLHFNNVALPPGPEPLHTNLQARQTGKTFNGMGKLLYLALRYPRSLILVTALKFDQVKNIAFKALNQHLDRMRARDPGFFKKVVGRKNVLRTIIRLMNGSTI